MYFNWLMNRVVVFYSIALLLILGKSLLKLIIPTTYITIVAYAVLLAIACLFLVNYKRLKPIVPQVNVLALATILTLFTYGIFSYLFPNPYTTNKAISITLLQFLFVPLFMFVTNNLAPTSFPKLAKLTEWIVLLFLAIGGIELMLPTAWRIVIIEGAEELMTGKRMVPVSYIVRDFGVDLYRIGSLYFESITLGFSAAIFAIFKLHHGSKFYNWKVLLAVVVCVFTFAKLAILILLLALVYKLLKVRVRYLSTLVLVSSIALIMLSFSYITSHSRSMANHFYGLKNGFSSAMNHPLGQGAGTAGYLVLSEFSPENPGPFNWSYEFSERENGNESAVGILLYQFGFPYVFVYLGMFLVPLLGIGNTKNWMYTSVPVGLVVSALLSESMLSVVICAQFIVFLFYSLTSNGQPNAKIADSSNN